MKNNKRGFTLIELIAAIVILITVVLIAVPSVTRLLKRNQNESQSARMNLAKDAAITAARDEEPVYDSSSSIYATGLTGDVEKYNGYICKAYSIQSLISSGYLKKSDADVDRSIGLTNNDVVIVYIKSKSGATGDELYIGGLKAVYIKAADNPGTYTKRGVNMYTTLCQ